MSNIRFDMGGGYVLNFSDRTFAQFFVEELNIESTTGSVLATGLEGEELAYFFQTVEKADSRLHATCLVGI